LHFKAVDVEAWLKAIPLARGSKAKIRNIMSALFSCHPSGKDRDVHSFQLLERMAGTTRLELATSAVTGQRCDVTD